MLTPYFAADATPPLSITLMFRRYFMIATLLPPLSLRHSDTLYRCCVDGDITLLMIALPRHADCRYAAAFADD